MKKDDVNAKRNIFLLEYIDMQYQKTGKHFIKFCLNIRKRNNEILPAIDYQLMDLNDLASVSFDELIKAMIDWSKVYPDKFSAWRSEIAKSSHKNNVGKKLSNIGLVLSVAGIACGIGYQQKPVCLIAGFTLIACWQIHKKTKGNLQILQSNLNLYAQIKAKKMLSPDP